jgi:2,3-bisphosphoglycerate-independent phosphoglycerate mutase
MNKKQVALIILDGWGYREDKEFNGIEESRKPNFDYLWSNFPHTLIEASGLAVGLPEGQMGNSEVGHTTIGAGRILDQDLVRIDKEINNGDFYKNKTFQNLFQHVKNNDSYLHVMGLISPGGVHSHMNHLFAFLELTKQNNIEKVVIHLFTDGRDVPPQSANIYVKELENKIKEIGLGKIASISGRFYAMDRDNNWDRLKLVEDLIFEGIGNICDIEPHLYIENLYKEGKVDEHLIPFLCLDENKNKYLINKYDGVFFFNFRADRARQLTKKILEKSEAENIFISTMTSYGDEYKTHVVYPSISIKSTLAKELSEKGFSQVHIAETEKFAHATYFLNGGVEKLYEKEEHVLVPSRKDIKTYDLAPKMSASGVADRAIEKIEEGFDFIFINFANADMVGHTAVASAIHEAIEEVDLQLGRVLEKLNEKGGIALITADHGNAEIYFDKQAGKPHTSHTNNKVPFIITSNEFELREEGGLSDVTPTVFKLLEIDKPEDMTGESLVL